MLVLAALLLQSAQPAAPPLHGGIHGGPEKMTCPIGGETFSAWQPGTYSTYGARPDGRPYSYLPFPFPIPECPSNHMILFDGKFSDAEKTQLGELLGSPEYRQLVGTDSAYYRGSWLAARIGRPENLSLGLLLRAIWEVTPGSLAPPPTPASLDRLRRYQAEFAERASRATLPPNDKLWLEARAVNALRQLGRFEEAERMRAKAVASFAQASDREGWDLYLEKLAVVIARRDSSPEPLDMIPRAEIASACMRREQPLGAFDQEACSKPEIKARIAEMVARGAKGSD